MTNILAVIRNSVQKIYLFDEMNSQDLKAMYSDKKTMFDYDDEKLIQGMYKKYFDNIVLGIMRYYQYKEKIEKDLKSKILDDYGFDMNFPSSIDEFSNNLIEVARLLEDKTYVETVLADLKNSDVLDCVEIYHRVENGLSTGVANDLKK